MAHEVQIKELVNGILITETIDGDIVERLISYQGKPFFRSTNESDEETYQIIDKVGEIYNIPALATDFVLIDINDAVFIPADGVELIEYSVKLRPFRGDTERDEVLSLGLIETTSNKVTIQLPSDGDTNSVLINGSLYVTYYKTEFNYTPVTANQKILIIYAKPDAQVFYLAQGAEAVQAVEPDYDGLFVARIIVNADGQIVEIDDTNYKLRSEDAWRSLRLNQPINILPYSYDLRSSYYIAANDSGGVIGGILNGLIEKNASPTWDGKEWWIYNATGDDLTFNSADVTDADVFLFTHSFFLKHDQSCKVKLHGDVLEIMGIMNGEAPDLSIYALDADLDTEIVNRALADNNLQSQITTEKNRNDTQDIAITTNTNAIADLYIGQAKFTVTGSITNETLSTVSNLKQNNRNNLIANGVNAINITLTSTAEAKFQAIYHKLGSGTITFVAGAGVTVVLIDGTAKMEGTAEMQTAAVHRDGNKYYVQISNR